MQSFTAEYTRRFRSIYPTGIVSSYYTWSAVNQPLLASAYVSKLSNATTIFSVSCTLDAGGGDKFVSVVRGLVKQLMEEMNLSDNLSMHEAGGLFFASDSVEGVKNDSRAMDYYILPLVLIILTILIRNVPLVIIPILSIVTSLLTQFFFMYLVVSSFGFFLYLQQR